MSQSDYLKYKRVSRELKTNKLSPVFNDQDYVSYKEYALENTISNSKLTYNQLIPPNTIRIMDMEKKTTDCPTFIICTNTHDRTNRVPLLGSQQDPSPSRPLSVKQRQILLANSRFCNCVKI